jgi:2-isopropylmalate synthase
MFSGCITDVKGLCAAHETDEVGKTGCTLILAKEGAIGAVDVRLKNNGHSQRGRGVSTDIIEASLMAYLDALNRLIPLSEEKEGEESFEE